METELQKEAKNNGKDKYMGNLNVDNENNNSNVMQSFIYGIKMPYNNNKERGE